MTTNATVSAWLDKDRAAQVTTLVLQAIHRMLVRLQESSLRDMPIYYFLDPRDSHLPNFLMQSLWNETQYNPLGHRYFSCVPYLLGEGQAMQYAFVSRSKVERHIPGVPFGAVRWPERLSPYIPVAGIHIPRQTFDHPAQFAFTRQLSINPWHCLPEPRFLSHVIQRRVSPLNRRPSTCFIASEVRLPGQPSTRKEMPPNVFRKRCRSSARSSA
mgnify:CR=1 FL=1